MIPIDIHQPTVTSFNFSKPHQMFHGNAQCNGKPFVKPAAKSLQNYWKSSAIAKDLGPVCNM